MSKKINHIFNKNISELTHKELSIEILKVTALGLLVASMFVAPGLGLVYKLFDTKSENEKRRIRYAFTRLKNDKKIKRSSSGSYVIANPGRKILNEEMLFETFDFEKPSKWDGKWFIVMFDIPNDQEYARKLLRNKLLDLGFLPYQHSVYILPYDCRKLIRKLEAYLQIEGCVRTLVASALDKEHSYIKSFSLK